MIIDSGTVFIDNMNVYAYHGVLEQERKVGGNFSVSLEVKANVVDAVITDSIDDAIDYSVLYEIVKNEMAKSAALLENVAGRIAQAIFEQYASVVEVVVKITKISPPAMPGCNGAGVVLHACNNT